MDMRKFAGSAFIKLEDDRDGLPRVETITSVDEGNFGRPVLKFETGERLTLNATNVKALINAYGADDRDWIGCEIELFVGQTKYQGQYKDSILVRPFSPEKEPARSERAIPY